MGSLVVVIIVVIMYEIRYMMGHIPVRLYELMFDAFVNWVSSTWSS